MGFTVGPNGGEKYVLAALSQLLSSGTNFGVQLLVVRAGSLREVGMFAVLYAGYFLLQGLVRSVLLEPAQIAVVEGKVGVEAAAQAGSLVASTAVAVPLMGWAVTLDGTAGTVVLAMAVCLPGLIGAESVRLMAIARGRAQVAVVMDVLWASILFAGFLLSLAVEVSVAAWVLVWGVGAYAGWMLGVMLRLSSSTAELGSVKLSSLVSRGYVFGIDAMVDRVIPLILMGSIGLLRAVEEVGLIGVARTAVAPIATMLVAISTVGLPALVRLRSSRERALSAIRMSLVGCACAGVFVACVVALPRGLGQLLYGRNWPPARELVLPIGLWTLAGGPMLGARLAAKALDQRGRLLRLRVGLSAPPLVATGIGLWAGMTVLSLVWVIGIAALLPALMMLGVDWRGVSLMADRSRAQRLDPSA